MRRSAGLWSAPLLVFLGFFFLTTLLYSSLLKDLPRADHLVFISNFREGGIGLGDLKRALFFEFFGSDKRFQPLAFPLVYLQWKLFGTQFVLYHLATIALHALNGTLLFALVRRFVRSQLFPLLVAALFLTAATHLDIIAWTVHFYVLLQVSLVLLAILCLLKWRDGSREAFLYLAYVLLLLQMFLTEVGVLFPGLVFLAFLLPRHPGPLWKSQVGRSLLCLASIYGLFFISFALFLVLDPRSMPAQLLSAANIARSFWGMVIHFGSTAFLHNMLYSAQIVIDDMVYFVPATWQSLSPTSGLAPRAVYANTLALAAVAILLFLARKPAQGQRLPVLLILAGGMAFSFLLLLARPTSYAVSQSRYAYIPTLTLVALLPGFLAHAFSARRGPGQGTGGEGARAAIIAALGVLILLNVIKTVDGARQVAAARGDTNRIYYAARSFLSRPESRDARLFISASTYPSHERLAWGTDIIADLFLADPRITRSISEATHVLLPEGDIQELAPRSLPRLDFASEGLGGDFYEDLTALVPRLAGRTVELRVSARVTAPDAVRPFLWSDGGGYVMGESFQGTRQFESLRMTGQVPKDAREMRVGLLFNRAATAWIAETALHEVSPPTGNMILNPELQAWPRGPGPFTGKGETWAAGWLTDLRGKSAIAITQEEASGAEVRYTHDAESYLVYNVPNPSSFSGRNATFSLQVKSDVAKAVRLGIAWEGNGGLWSDFHPGDGLWHTLSLSGPLPEKGVRSLSLLVVLDRSAAIYLASPRLFGSPAWGPNLLENPGFPHGWQGLAEGEASFVTGEAFLPAPLPTPSPDDFTITFGIMPTGWPGEPLEVFGFTSATEEHPRGWFLRLLFAVGQDSPQAGYTRLELGRRQGTEEKVAFSSRPLAVRREMNHFVLGREEGVFYLILNGELIEKVRDNTGEDFRNMGLVLGEVYSLVYPYYQHHVPYFAYTQVQIGESKYPVLDKPLGHRFGEISFNRLGFMPYHFSLGW